VTSIDPKDPRRDNSAYRKSKSSRPARAQSTDPRGPYKQALSPQEISAPRFGPQSPTQAKRSRTQKRCHPSPGPLHRQSPQ